MNDYSYVAGNMEEIIAKLEAKRAEMDTTMENVKETLKVELLQTGMTGDTADILLDTFQREVVAPAEQYLNTAMTYITKNRAVDTAMQENIKRNNGSAA